MADWPENDFRLFVGNLGARGTEARPPSALRARSRASPCRLAPLSHPRLGCARLPAPPAPAGNDATDLLLMQAFSKYPSFQRARAVRDKRYNKPAGYGFVSFKEPWDMTAAMREMNNKYIGSRPVKLKKSNWKARRGRRAPAAARAATPARALQAARADARARASCLPCCLSARRLCPRPIRSGPSRRARSRSGSTTRSRWWRTASTRRRSRGKQLSCRGRSVRVAKRASGSAGDGLTTTTTRQCDDISRTVLVTYS